MITYDYDETTGCVSILIQTETGNHRESLTPGEFDRAKRILPDNLYAEIQTLWTKEIIEAWQAKCLFATTV